MGYPNYSSRPFQINRKPVNFSFHAKSGIFSMKILQISPECYPAAKAGGLGDVVGALPKYLNQAGHATAVVIPKYETKWLNRQQYATVYSGAFRLNQVMMPFTIERVLGEELEYPLYVANVPTKFDRPGIYQAEDGTNFGDEIERSICFQNAVLTWVRDMNEKPKILHCHDHVTGLVPFLVKYCPDYKILADIPTIFTIHNGEYHGAYSWNKMHLLPFFDANARGLLDWGNTINPLATAIKTSWRITTVSPTYLEELMTSSNGLEGLLRGEQHKAYGILNGIDTQVWDPSKDTYIQHKHGGDISGFKDKNKDALLSHFDFNKHLPVITFIGRLRREKGADLLPGLIGQVLESGLEVAFLILGTGEHYIHQELQYLRGRFPAQLDIALEYNEGLAHQLYAGADFLMMPSRVEPCGLNQMYAMRYGTVPIVRTAGGLKDTVIDMFEEGPVGRGIRFDQLTVGDAHHAVYRAFELFHNKELFREVRQRIMNIDFSWEKSTKAYIDIYEELSTVKDN
jgi:starch synthase